MHSSNGSLGWRLTSFTYGHFSAAATPDVDDTLLCCVESSLPGATVADCGCGPGHMAKLFLERGAERVYAIDLLDEMLDQVPSDKRIIKVRADLRQGVPKGVECALDVVLFKRFLYFPPSLSEKVLRQWYDTLSPSGHFLLVHPEKEFFSYVFGNSHPFLNLAKRVLPLFLDAVGAYEYQLYTSRELHELCSRAVPEGVVRALSSRQRSYNLVDIVK